MNRYSLRHLSDHRLLHDLAAMVARERESTADVLAHIAEVSTRKLHLKAAANNGAKVETDPSINPASPG